MKADDIYTSVTGQLVQLIEQGIADPDGWRKPWSVMTKGHFNATTDNPYHGLNQLLLSLVAGSRGYEAPVWATFKQWHDAGYKLKSNGEAKGAGVHLIRWVDVKPRDGATGSTSRRSRTTSTPSRERRLPSLSDDSTPRTKRVPTGFCVFNAAVVDGYKWAPPNRPEHERLDIAERLIAAMRNDGLTIRHQEIDRAFYSPSDDMIVTPPMNAFPSADRFYSTMFHELSHSTSNDRRVGRATGGRFGSTSYAEEELIAELSSAFLCATTGIEDQPTLHHADYLANWLQVLRNDPKAIALAATAGQKAANYILGLGRGVEQTHESTDDLDAEMAALAESTHNEAAMSL